MNSKITRQRLAVVLVLASAFLVGGCTSVAGNFNPSVESVKALKRITKNTSATVNLGEFSSGGSMTSSVPCRLDAGIHLPDKVAYEDYIRNAFASELIFARTYSEASKVTIHADFQKIGLSSITGNWTISANVRSSNDTQISIESEYDFDSAFGAGAACNKAAAAFARAVQAFIDDIIEHPDFAKLIAAQE